MHRLFPILLCPLLAAGCASPGQLPSLSPRAAESIDPRLPVTDVSAALPADPALAAALGAIRNRAVSAARGAEPAIGAAERAVTAAGVPESESWIAAQQLLSAAIAQRAPFTTALGDLDALIAERVRVGGRLVPRDLAAVQTVAAELQAIDRRQAGEIARLERQLQR